MNNILNKVLLITLSFFLCYNAIGQTPYYGKRHTTTNVIMTHRAATATTIDVDVSVQDASGTYDGTTIQTGDWLYYMEAGITYFLPVVGLSNVSASSVRLTVNKGTLPISVIPTQQGAVYKGTSQHKIPPFVGDLTAGNQQALLEQTFHVIDSLLGSSTPEIANVSGCVAPINVPVLTDAKVAQNGCGELYSWDAVTSTWIKLPKILKGGSGINIVGDSINLNGQLTQTTYLNATNDYPFIIDSTTFFGATAYGTNNVSTLRVTNTQGQGASLSSQHPTLTDKTASISVYNNSSAHLVATQTGQRSTVIVGGAASATQVSILAASATDTSALYIRHNQWDGYGMNEQINSKVLYYSEATGQITKGPLVIPSTVIDKDTAVTGVATPVWGKVGLNGDQNIYNIVYYKNTGIHTCSLAKNSVALDGKIMHVYNLSNGGTNADYIEVRGDAFDLPQDTFYTTQNQLLGTSFKLYPQERATIRWEYDLPKRGYIVEIHSLLHNDVRVVSTGTAHGFVLTPPFAVSFVPDSPTTGKWVLADAAIDTAWADGIVTHVPSTTTLAVQANWKRVYNSYVPGNYYFLSETPGVLTAISPLGSQPILKAYDSEWYMEPFGWRPANISSGSRSVETDATIDGDGSLSDPLKIAQNGAITGQVLSWNGTAFVPTTFTASSGFECLDTVSITGITPTPIQFTGMIRTTAGGWDNISGYGQNTLPDGVVVDINGTDLIIAECGTYYVDAPNGVVYADSASVNGFVNVLTNQTYTRPLGHVKDGWMIMAGTGLAFSNVTANVPTANEGLSVSQVVMCS